MCACNRWGEWGAWSNALQFTTAMPTEISIVEITREFVRVAWGKRKKKDRLPGDMDGGGPTHVDGDEDEYDRNIVKYQLKVVGKDDDYSSEITLDHAVHQYCIAGSVLLFMLGLVFVLMFVFEGFLFFHLWCVCIYASGRVCVMFVHTSVYVLVFLLVLCIACACACVAWRAQGSHLARATMRLGGLAASRAWSRLRLSPPPGSLRGTCNTQLGCCVGQEPMGRRRRGEPPP